MDNLSELLGSIMSDPQAMKQIQDMAGQLGIGDIAGERTAPETTPDRSSREENTAEEADILGMVGKIAPLLAQINKEDDATRLLHALRPYLGENRQKKADEAQKLLGIMRVMTLLKDQKIF